MQTESSSILEETIATIDAILGSELDEMTVERVVIGLFFTGVKLSNGSTGSCATPIKTIPEAVCCPSSAMAMPFPGKLAGRRAADLAREALSGHGIRRAVGIAAVNALADYCWQRRPHPDVELCPGVDAFDATEIRKGDKVVSTLVNNTLEDLLALARPEARVTIVGPTVGMQPDAFLARGADVLGCVKISAPDAFLDLLAEGGSGYHFFGRSAQKVVLARRPIGFDSRVA